MSEKNLKKRLEFQQKMITRQSEQIDELKNKIEVLNEIIKEKDEVINSISPMREELKNEIANVNQKKKEYSRLIKELKTMKNIINEDVYKKRWWLIKFLLK